MAQAIDLPDPLQNASSAPRDDADDLLAKLAGEEVDRLLAEADTDRAPAAESIVDIPAALVTATVESTPQSTPATSPALTSEGDGDLDALLSQIADGAVSAGSFDAPAVSVSDADMGALSLQPTGTEESETTPLQRQGLLSDMRAPGAEEFDRPLPLFLKPLEWINAPVDSMSSRIRTIIGQIAIFTLINSIAVLVYVFFFRSK